MGIWFVAAVGLVGVSAGALFSVRAAGIGRGCPAAAGTLQVAAAAEIAPVVAEVGRLLASGPDRSCLLLTVSTQEPADVADAVAAGAAGPDVWVPDS